MRALSLLFLIAIGSLCGADNTLVGTFINPPPTVLGPPPFSTNPVWTLGDTQSIQWTTTFTNYTITMWQQLGSSSANAGPSIFQTDTGKDGSQFDWIVQSYAFDLANSPVFFLWLTENGNASAPSLPSRYFNLTASSSSSTSSTSSLPTSTQSTASKSPTSSSTTSSTSQALPLSNAHHKSSLSAGAKAGIAIGVVAVVAIIGVLAAVLLAQRRKNNSKIAATDAPRESGSEGDDKDGKMANAHLLGPGSPMMLESSSGPVMLDNNQRPIMLDSHQRPMPELQ